MSGEVDTSDPSRAYNEHTEVFRSLTRSCIDQVTPIQSHTEK